MVIGGSIQCCILKPSLIVDPLQIAVAAKKAVLNEQQNKMATKSLYTEILFNLSLSKNITQSLIKFGISDTDNNAVVCVIGKNEEELDKVLSHFQCDEPSGNQQFSPDNSLIKKEYKITGVETEVSSLLGSVVSRIAAKDFVSL
ncbi:TP53RK-binding protein [Gryllus bimaculatus]|nr:TP53RK-binding protein [Gryllus bimaculatus]